MGVGVPAGTISAFASTTCPTGWSEYTLARGRFLRGIDNGAGNDPSGTRVAGDVQEDAFKTHTSDISPGGSASSSPGTGYIRGGDASGAGYNITITSTGGTTETRPKNVAVTYCQFNGTTNGWNSSLAGPGASVLSDLTDVTFSGLASGNSLLYNGSAWVNQTLDKIVSGTTNVTARTDGTISFTTGGVTTGYFDTAGRLVVPGISVTTKQTSVTTLYASGNIESDGVLTLKNTTAQLNLWGEAPVAWKWSIGDSGDSTDDLLIYDREHSAIRLIIDDTTGSVGINTSSPQYPLDVSSTSSYAIRGVTSAPTYAIMGQSTNSSYGGVIGYSANSSNYGILGYGNGYGGYFDGTTYGAYGISSAGTGVHGYSTSSIGVRGQSSTYYGGYFDGQYGVYAVGNVGSATANAMYNSNSAGVAFVANNTGTGKYCYIGYTSSYALYCDGPVYSSSGWVNPSDKRLKTDIRPIQSALDKLTLLNGVEFEWKDKTKHKDDKKPGGFIAQDVKKIFPEFVEEKECVENKETGPNPECEMVGKDKKILMLKLSNKFNAYVVEAMKELKTENDTLKAQLSDMEKRLQALEAK
ncbi:MAG: hypothetical protein COY40_01245 [Alphaproteobacteria bacterium CG_4_10_14_0_8_um_filter_53_9]|nr:MAG: hypothetical protein COY40_01245 [Alphaproteobacteria bacterium CG_4_10_14_0_8_um_filter_53_9]